MSTIITMAYLLVLGIVDWKKKAIPLWMLMAMGTIAIVSRIAEYIFIGRGISIYEITAGIGIAAVLIIIGLRGHMLGVADSIVVGIMSWIIGIRRAVTTFLLALIFISVMSGVLLALRKVKLKDTIPFLPFMFFLLWGLYYVAEGIVYS